MKPHDPKTNRQMSEPLGDKDAATARIDAFAEELGALRIKHHMLDIAVIYSTTYCGTYGTEESDEERLTGSVIFGNQLDCLMMASAMTESLKTGVEELLSRTRRKAGGK